MKRNNQGFTLIEILLVVIIIGVLAAMVVPNLAGKGEKARITAANADIEASLSVALDMYELDVGKYPTTTQGLKALLIKPTNIEGWDGPYLKKKVIPKDPWQREYLYISPGSQNPESYDLSSLGPDGVQSTDDIVNWFVSD